MKNVAPFARALACLLFCSVLLYACDSGSTSTTKTDKSRAATGVDSYTIPTIYLDSLFISGTDFEKYTNSSKQNNMSFGYYFTDTAVTLRGWVLVKGKSGQGNAAKDTGTYDPTQYITLTPKARTTVTIGPGTLLSNQVILGKYVKEILQKINNKNAEIHFKPYRDSVIGQLRYRIRIKIVGGLPNEQRFLEGEFLTNPAPPRQAYD